MQSEFRKSVYIFLCSLLGVMLFLTLHRILLFMLALWFNASSGGNAFFGLSYLEFLALDYFTLFITIILGAWYGIWVGIYWYKKVYEDRAHGGVVSHIAANYWPSKKTSNLKAKIEATKKHLQDDLWQLSDLSKSLPASTLKVRSLDRSVGAAAPQKILKRKIVRKKAPKNLL